MKPSDALVETLMEFKHVIEADKITILRTEQSKKPLLGQICNRLDEIHEKVKSP